MTALVAQRPGPDEPCQEDDQMATLARVETLGWVSGAPATDC